MNILNKFFMLVFMCITHSIYGAYEWTFTNLTNDSLQVRTHGGVWPGHFDTTQTIDPQETKTFKGKGAYCRAGVDINGQEVAGSKCGSGKYYIASDLKGTESKAAGQPGNFQVTVVNNAPFNLNITAQGQIFGKNTVYYQGQKKSSIDIHKGETLTITVEAASGKLYFTPYINEELNHSLQQSSGINDDPSLITITTTGTYKLFGA